VKISCKYFHKPWFCLADIYFLMICTSAVQVQLIITERLCGHLS